MLLILNPFLISFRNEYNRRGFSLGVWIFVLNKFRPKNEIGQKELGSNAIKEPFVFRLLLHSFIDTLIFINIALAVFNLIPIPPLDGSKILLAFIPYKYKYISDFIDRYGVILLFALIYLIYRTGFLYSIVINIVYFLTRISPW